MTTTSALDSTYSSALGNVISQSAGGNNMDKDSFLMLLVTQFKYQDPLNPMEDKEFVAQLAQFNALEQSMQTNDNLESLLNLQGQQITIGAANYIGREVAARGYGVSVSGGKASKIEYATSEDMVSGYANILNGTSVVATISLGSLTAGAIGEVAWDGTLNTGGKASDGVYNVSIIAYNADGQQLQVDTQVTGKVEAVSSYNGEHYLRLDGGRSVLLSNVREIIDASTVTSSSATVTAIDGETPTLRYKVAEAITKGKVTITDGKDEVVRTIKLSANAAGTHNFKWDGKDDDGDTVPNGDYTLTFQAENAEGKMVTVNVSTAA